MFALFPVHFSLLRPSGCDFPNSNCQQFSSVWPNFVFYGSHASMARLTTWPRRRKLREIEERGHFHQNLLQSHVWIQSQLLLSRASWQPEAAFCVLISCQDFYKLCLARRFTLVGLLGNPSYSDFILFFCLLANRWLQFFISVWMSGPRRFKQFKCQTSKLSDNDAVDAWTWVCFGLLSLLLEFFGLKVISAK